MNNETKKRQVRIFNSTTGTHRLSEPVVAHASNTSDSVTPIATGAELNQGKPGEMPSSSSPLTTGSGAAQSSASKEPAAQSEGKDKNAAGNKPKADVETLEQFIAYAYARKGQRLSLKSKTEGLIARNLCLDDMALIRLNALAEADMQLAVPRQLLLISREIERIPALRAAISGFVSNVMLRHPIFFEADLQAVVRNLPDALPLIEAFKKVADFKPAPVEGKDAIKPAELQALRLNALNLLAIWLSVSRGLNIEDLASLLFLTMWAPAARDLADDNARLRALTEIEQVAGVGLACDRFRQRATDAQASQDQAQRDVTRLREEISTLEIQREHAEVKLDVALEELRALKESSAAELVESRKQHDVERTHLRHDMEQLRGRLVRRLSDSIGMLEVGLTALRNKMPRTEVMVERAEHVIDALRAEESNLREE
jgi:hypothetical protein